VKVWSPRNNKDQQRANMLRIRQPKSIINASFRRNALLSFRSVSITGFTAWRQRQPPDFPIMLRGCETISRWRDASRVPLALPVSVARRGQSIQSWQSQWHTVKKRTTCFLAAFRSVRNWRLTTLARLATERFQHRSGWRRSRFVNETRLRLC